MGPILTVLVVILCGATTFLIIMEPNTEAFELKSFDGDNVVGPLWPLLTVVLTATNMQFDKSDYTSWPSILMLAFVIFFVVIVLLNLVIATMASERPTHAFMESDFLPSCVDAHRNAHAAL